MGLIQINQNKIQNKTTTKHYDIKKPHKPTLNFLDIYSELKNSWRFYNKYHKTYQVAPYGTSS